MPAFFSKSCEYGLQAVLFIAKQNSSRSLHLEEIASELNLPKNFLSKVLQKLSRAKVVKSQKGNQGGFKLSKPATQITLGDIVLAIDGIDFLNKCILGFPGCSNEHACSLHSYWSTMREIVSKMLNERNIADLSKGLDIKIGLLNSGYKQRRILKSA
jgi:Rrf2 family iron-sulfur cluster assembly transcriptional regulator